MSEHSMEVVGLREKKNGNGGIGRIAEIVLSVVIASAASSGLSIYMTTARNEANIASLREQIGILSANVYQRLDKIDSRQEKMFSELYEPRTQTGRH